LKSGLFSGRPYESHDGLSRRRSRKRRGVSATAKRVGFATVADFVGCDAVAFGSPNYFSYMAGLMKDFFGKALSIRNRVEGKLVAAFTS